MWRLSIFLVAVTLFASVFASPAVAEDTAQKRIMVWRLEAKSGVEVTDVDSLSGYITAEVERCSGQQVISEADISTILKGEEARQQCGGEDSACIAEIGNALGVPEAISGDVGRVGDFWFLNLRRLNVRRATVISRSSRKVRGDINALIETLSGAVEELFGVSSKQDLAAKEGLQTPEPQLSTDAEAVVQDYPMNPYKTWGHGCFWTGLGITAIAGGVGFGLGAKYADDYQNQSSGSINDLQDKSKTMTGLGYAGVALGGALMVTGVILWALSPGDETWWKKHQLSAGVSHDGENGVLSIGGRW